MARTRGKTAARGYGGEHQVLRARWKPQVEAGGILCHAAICLMPSRRIAPGTPWNLGHTPDRTAYTGPEHERCNKTEGASRGNRMQPRPFIAAAGSAATCKTCGKTYHYAARACEICGVHFHPSGASVRTCGRTCGVELRRRNRNGAYHRNRSSARNRMPAPPDVVAMISAHGTYVRTAPLRTSRNW